MKYFRLVASALLIGQTGAYLVTPPGTAAPGTISTCSGWVQQSYLMDCTMIERVFGMSEAQFTTWNPIVLQLGPNCTLLPAFYYCVEINYSAMPTVTTLSTLFSSSTSIAPVTTTTSSGQATCTGAQTAVAIASPAPSGSVCGMQANGVALAGTGFLNIYTTGSPYVATIMACISQCLATAACTNVYFIAGTSCNQHYGPVSYSINTNGVNAYTLYEMSCFTGLNLVAPTPSGAVCGTQANSVALTGAGTLVIYSTGSPYVASIQACVAICLATATCTNVYYIAGTNCNLHYGVNSFITITNGVNAYSLYDTTCFRPCRIAPTITVGNGISTPLPHQTAMALNCNSFHLVVSGDQCSTIAAAAGVSLANFYAWNPAVGSTCATLGLGNYVCIDIFGVTPTSATSTVNGIATPTPVQTGMTTNCHTFYLVVSGDQCGTIATKTGITLANFYLWNPAVGSTCATLGLGNYVCVGIT